MRGGWRTELAHILKASLDQELVIGELVARLTPLVPLEQATRAWLGRNRTRITSPAEIPPAPLRMRRYIILQELWSYPLAWKHPRRSMQPVADADVFMPRSRACVRCGAPFISRNRAVTCGPKCAAQMRVSHGQPRSERGRYLANGSA